MCSNFCFPAAEAFKASTARRRKKSEGGDGFVRPADRRIHDDDERRRPAAAVGAEHLSLPDVVQRFDAAEDRPCRSRRRRGHDQTPPRADLPDELVRRQAG